MANTLKGSVWVVDTDGAMPLTGHFKVIGVVIVAGADEATLSLKVDGTSGTTVFQGEAATNTKEYYDVEFTGQALAADIGGTSAVAYVYLK